ncbi:hypothetical protein [Ruficoccus sp. ZRK36]|uniref:hypothetical protein n=1 Tax=Ruficoccus sp. ZRK36 TaxID=2866311 RepID=UPI001C72EA6A|nr:hypothetical protein [Ruficoccus sp. ZRK36]QYY35308.1 hypothetical protein K0V07_13530 [Ruficoccus sp. ZRK36]
MSKYLFQILRGVLRAPANEEGAGGGAAVPPSQDEPAEEVSVTPTSEQAEDMIARRLAENTELSEEDEGAPTGEEAASSEDQPKQTDAQDDALPVAEEQREAFEAMSAEGQQAVRDIMAELADRAEDDVLALTDAQKKALDELSDEDRAAVEDMLDPYLGAREEAEEGEDEDPEKSDFKNLPKWAKKEISDHRKRSREAQSKVAEAEEQVATANKSLKAVQAELDEVRAKRIVPAPTAQNPLSAVEDIDAYEEDIFRLQVWLERHPEGGEYTHPGADQPTTYTDEQIPELKALVQKDLLRNIPRRREYIAAEQKFEGQTRQAFPQLDKEGHWLAKDVNMLYGKLPEVKRYPAHRGALVRQAVGGKLIELFGPKAVEQLDKWIEQAAQGKANPKGKGGRPDLSVSTKPKVRKPLPIVRGSKPRPAPRRSVQSAMEKGGSLEEAEALLAERL